MRTRILAFLSPALFLAACGEDEAVIGGSDGREASGEILPSSISDEMIATDRLRSQPPLLSEAPEGSGDAAAGEAPEADIATGEADEGAAAAPEAEAGPDEEAVE